MVFLHEVQGSVGYPLQARNGFNGDLQSHFMILKLEIIQGSV